MSRLMIAGGLALVLALAATARAQAPSGKPAPPPELVRARDRIDAIDRQLRELLFERARVVREVAEIKRQRGLPVRNPEREKQVIAQLTAGPPGPLPPGSLVRIWQQIFIEMYLLEEEPPGRAPAK
jgi:chorismate mutase-like protein